MHKSDLAKKVADATGLSNKDAEAAVDAAFDSIADTLATGEKVVITGFGTFERKRRKARTGRHPSTGAVINIPAKNAASFSAGKILKEKIEG
jgi:DNA-binding protein HU-beta